VPEVGISRFLQEAINNRPAINTEKRDSKGFG
jgi:hypothetical protein